MPEEQAAAFAPRRRCEMEVRANAAALHLLLLRHADPPAKRSGSALLERDVRYTHCSSRIVERRQAPFLGSEVEQRVEHLVGAQIALGQQCLLDLFGACVSAGMSRAFARCRALTFGSGIWVAGASDGPFACVGLGQLTQMTFMPAALAACTPGCDRTAFSLRRLSARAHRADAPLRPQTPESHAPAHRSCRRARRPTCACPP